MFVSLNKRLCVSATAFLLMGALSCSKKTPDDEERLKQKIDVTSVHIYAAVKNVISSSNADPALKEAVERMLVLLAKGDVNDMKAQGDKLEMRDLVTLGTAMLSLKSAGQEIVQGKRSEGEPLIRRLLLLLGVPDSIAGLFNTSTDHAALFVTEAILKLHEKSPVPIPVEVVLYEAWRTDTAALTVPGLDSLVQSLRAYYYGMNDFCFLAEKDATALKESTQKNEALIKAVTVLSEGAVRPDDKDVKLMVFGMRMVGDAGPAICYYNRGDDRAARPWLKAVLDDADASGLPIGEQTAALRIIYECGGTDDDIVRGKAMLAKTAPPKDDLEKTDRELLGAYCDASWENKIEILRKISLAAKTVKIAARAVERSGAVKELEGARIFRAAASVATLCEKAASSESKVKGAVDAVRGFFSKKE